MPLTILPHRLAAPSDRRAKAKRDSPDEISIALVNNMPDGALESTVAQFSRLLRTAAGPLAVKLRICYLPEVPRGPEALEHVRSAYWPVSELLKMAIDGVIITGAEPRANRLPEEAYWHRLEQLLEWAETHTVSSIWSCLAAHAAVQVLDCIERTRLAEKRCGVFQHAILPTHPMMSGVRAPLATPHSRWNELSITALRNAGYTIVSSSPETGADLFVKQGRSLLVFFQGHPEYEDTTLLREYRRDIGRFLRAEQSHYPALPQGYFSAQAAAQLAEFQARAVVAPEPDLLASFPIDSLFPCVQSDWAVSAVRIYRNWLELIASAKNRGFAAVSVGA